MERAEYNRHSRARMAETAKDASRHRSAGRAGAHRPSEALHPTRSSDVLPRIARERVPTVPHVAKTRRNVPRRIAPTAHFERNDVTIICETVHQGFFAEMESIRPHSGSNPRLLCLTNVYFGQQWFIAKWTIGRTQTFFNHNPPRPLLLSGRVRI